MVSCPFSKRKTPAVPAYVKLCNANILLMEDSKSTQKTPLRVLLNFVIERAKQNRRNLSVRPELAEREIDPNRNQSFLAQPFFTQWLLE